MFFQNMAIAAQQVAILYLIVAVGFAVDKIGIFKQSTAKLSNDLLFYVTTPTVIVQSFLSMQFNSETAKSFGIAFVCMAGTLIVGLVLALPFFRKEGNDTAVFKYAVSYGNMGYMALPLCQAMLGDEGVFYCSSGVVAFNIISFTHGIWLMTRDGGKKVKFELKRLVLNPGVISVLIGAPLFVLGVKLPVVLQKTVDHISNLNTPLAMLFLGTYIANTDLKSMFKDKRNYLVVLLKLLVLPAAMLAIFRLCGISGALLTTLIISASAPSANNTVMFAAKYDKDMGVASKIVAMCSLFCIITIPVMIAFAGVV